MAVAIFLVYLVPPSLLFLSMTRIVVALQLQDNTWSLVLVYPTITVPVSVWLLVGFLKAVPKDIEEQAMVDGCSRLTAFIRTVVPLAFPGIVAVVVFAFTVTASEFIYALAFIAPTSQKVLSTGVPTELIRGDVFYLAVTGSRHGARRPAGGVRVQPVPQPVHHRLHHGRGEGVRPAPEPPNRRRRRRLRHAR